jgi:hypothetical protein
MDKARAEYLRGVALQQQHKAFLKWGNMPAKASDRECEIARQECGAWATAAAELDAIVRKQEQPV